MAKIKEGLGGAMHRGTNRPQAAQAASPPPRRAHMERGYRGLWHGKGGNEDCDHLVLVVDPIVKPLTSLSLKASWSLKFSLVYTRHRYQIKRRAVVCAEKYLYYTLMRIVAPISRSMY